MYIVTQILEWLLLAVAIAVGICIILVCRKYLKKQ